MKLRKISLMLLSTFLLWGCLSTNTYASNVETGITVEEVVKAAGNVTVNVTNYGADGSDSATDNEAIQDALDYVTAQGGGTVVVPSGKYYLDNSLVISSNTHLKLDASAEMIRKDASKPMLRNYSGDVNTVLAGKGYSQSANITIEGGTWNGNISGSSYDVSEDIFRIYCATSVEIKDCTLKGVCGYHHINLGSVDTATISNVTFKDFVYSSGTDYSSLETGEENTNELNAKASITSEALQFDYFENKKNGCKNIVVENCTFKGVLSAVGNHHEESSATNVTIRNNTFENIANTCVNLYGFKEVSVSGNTAKNVRSFARVYAGSDCTITNNTITTYSGANNFNMFRISDGAVLTISKNTITGAGLAGIKLDSSSNATISDNKISNTTHNAITVNNSTAKITGNTITGAKNIGVYYSKGKGSISNNTIDRATLRGIGIQNKSSVTSIDGNTITNGKEQGIYVSESSVVTTIAKNTLKKNGTDAISILNSTVETIGGSSANKNTISTPGASGIYVSASEVGKVSYNKISSAAKKSGAAGIRINKVTTKITIEKNTITSAKQFGIYSTSSKVNIKSNEITTPALTAIYLKGGSGSVTKNTITENASGAGIYVVEKAKLKNVSENTITKSKENSIYFKDSTVTNISNNVIESSGTSSINLSNTTADAISGNTITSAKRDGIRITKSKASISGNVIKKSKTYGIYVENSGSNVTIKKNTIDKTSSGNGIRICDGKATIDSNTIKNTASQGIYIVKGTVTLGDGNKVSGKNAFKAKGGKVYMVSGNAKMLLSGKVLSVQGVSSSSATTVTIPSKVQIGDVSFNVTSIADNAFKDNKKIKTVVIGDKIEKIGKKAFYNCSKLATIKVKTTKLSTKKVGDDAFKKIKDNCTFEVPKKKASAYKKLFIAKGASKKIVIKKKK